MKNLLIKIHLFILKRRFMREVGIALKSGRPLPHMLRACDLVARIHDVRREAEGQI